MKNLFSTAAAIVAAGALSLTACSSGGSGGSKARSSSDPIKIMAFGSFSQPPFAVPEIVTGAQAAVARVNREGGVAGRQVALVTCDDKGNPNGAAACGREAVTDHVAAVVGAFTFFGDSIVPLLDKANIPYILPVANSPAETSDRVSFPLFTGATAEVGAYAAVTRDGCAKVAVMTSDVATGHALYDGYQVPVAKKVGVTAIPIYIPATATDIAPYIAQARAAGADCFSFGVSGQLTSAALRSLAQAGSHARSASNALALPEVVLGQISAQAEGFLAVSNFYYPSSGKADAVQLATDMAAVNKSAPVDDASINAYAGVMVFQQAAKGLDEVTGASVLDALKGMKTLDVGLFPPVDMTTVGYMKTLPRVPSSDLVVYVAHDGKYVPSGKPNVDLSKLLAGL
jgi:ABC-type branched-subunit amino acid transport system substrate-binding protein